MLHSPGVLADFPLADECPCCAQLLKQCLHAVCESPSPPPPSPTHSHSHGAAGVFRRTCARVSWTFPEMLRTDARTQARLPRMFMHSRNLLGLVKPLNRERACFGIKRKKKGGGTLPPFRSFANLGRDNADRLPSRVSFLLLFLRYHDAVEENRAKVKRVHWCREEITISQCAL